MQGKILVDIDREGNMTVHASGFPGKKCEDATKALEKALGLTIDKKKTKEFYQIIAPFVSERN